VELLCDVRHPNVVAVYGFVVSEESALALVMEYMDGGTVYDLLQNAREGSGVKPHGRHMLRLVRGLAAGMAHVHSKGVLHRDLKSPNVLLDAKGETLKVCDFGLSRRAFETAAMTRVGSVCWASPEILLGLAYHTATDVWSFGVVMWELATGAIPYDGLSKMDVATRVALEGLRLMPPKPDPVTCPIELLRLMATCFAPAAERPEFHQIVTALDACAESMHRTSAGHPPPPARAAPPVSGGGARNGSSGAVDLNTVSLTPSSMSNNI